MTIPNIDLSDGESAATATAVTANGDYPDANGIGYVGPRYFFNATGTWDGASVKIQHKPQGHSNWADVADSTLSASGSKLLKISKGSNLKAVVSSAGGSTSIQLTLSPDEEIEL